MYTNLWRQRQRPCFEHFSVKTHIQTFCSYIKTSSSYNPELQNSNLKRPIQNPAFILYNKLLLQCTAPKSVTQAMEVHARIVKSGVYVFSKTRYLLIGLYAKSQYFDYARKLVVESPEPDLVAWSSLISGYVKNGLASEAISAFYEMYLLGVKCNEFTFPSILKACTIKKDLSLGMQLHGIVVLTGFEFDEYVGNALVVMYAKCGEFGDARQLFDAMPERNVVSWNALFSCYVQSDFCEEGACLFQDMISSGVKPTEYSLSSMINACTGLGDGSLGTKVHGYIIKLGYDSDRFSANALVDMYAKLGDIEDSLAVFEEIAKPDIVSWNATISGCVLHEHYNWALQLFCKMNRLELCHNMITLSSILKACAEAGMVKLGKQVHSNLIKMNTKLDMFIGVGLVDMYSKCRLMKYAKKVFDLMPEKDLITCNAMITGHSLNGEDMEATLILPLMHRQRVGFNQTTLSTVLKSIASLQATEYCVQVHAHSLKSGFEFDNYVVNSFVDAYGKCGCIEVASKIFKESPITDLVGFTSMITGFSQDGQGEEALRLYLEMQEKGIKPDSFAYSTLLNACAGLSAYEQGKQVHVHILKFGFMSDIFAGNSLVNMYAKCGSINDAELAFSEIPERGIISWSAMIGGLAQHGHGKEALRLFDKMLACGVTPNQITLVSVLKACNHTGLVDEAKNYFNSMENLFGVRQTQEHYACMIDLLGRAGKLGEAMELVNTMPFQANASVWGALLGAARIHKNIELGQQAANMLFTLEPEKSGTHVLLANIYASAGMWDQVAKMRRLMKDSKVKKEPGISWMEIKDKVYTFTVGDRSNPRSHEIYAKLDELSDLLNKAGYVPMVEIDLHDVERSEKEKLLLYHSEKLAVAFGLIVTPAGAPIRVKKNLRVCVDCHTVLKFISKIVSRDIIVRDVNRFHHFRDGSCSCGDYW